MVFDALSDGINAVSPTYREPMEHRHDFVKIMKNDEKSMFPKMTQEHSGDVKESLGLLWSDSGCSRMLLIDFQEH